MLWICVVIGIIVFGAMAYAMFKFRKSKGAVAAQFSHNTTAELIWTIIPVVILIVCAWPATKILVRVADTSNPELHGQDHRLPVEVALRIRRLPGQGDRHQLHVEARLGQRPRAPAQVRR